MPCNVELLCLGNELLNGKVVNTNAQWLAERITNLGGEVKRITVVGDDVETISSVLIEALQRRPQYIITTGGLGPTFDDKTLKGVASALNLQLAVNQEALEMIRERYARRFQMQPSECILTPARIKMAALPRGFKPLHNPVGSAPGVIGRQDNSTIISLPGVPGEMKAIFDESVAPLIRSSASDRFYHERNLRVTGIIESELAPLIDEVMKVNPSVYIKSRPFAGRPHPVIKLHLSTTTSTDSEGLELLKASSSHIERLIREHGGLVDEEAAQDPDPSSSGSSLIFIAAK